MDRDGCLAIEGIFSILVFLNHFKGYCIPEGSSILYSLVSRCLGQLIVVPFLFYSGYGVMYSMTRKGSSYINAFPKRRIFRIWLHFALMVVLYLIAGHFIGLRHAPLTVLLSFIGLSSVGNSSWYMFAVLCLYVFSFIAARADPSLGNKMLVILCLLTVCYMVLLSQTGYTFYYDTVPAFTAGAVFGRYQKEVDDFLTGEKNRYWKALAALILIFIISYVLRVFTHSIISYILWSGSFAFVLVFATMKICFSNAVLRWLGHHIFEIYILQRLPMMVLRNTFSSGYIYFVVCMTAALLLSALFHFCFQIVDKKIYSI